MKFVRNTGIDGKAVALAKVISEKIPGINVVKLLVIGCGSGMDAWTLGEYFDCKVVAIDINRYFDDKYADRVEFHLMDACNLDFADQYFDMVYSFHVLEHIPDYMRVMSESRRVLRLGGVYSIGTPNRLRIPMPGKGYTLYRKIQSNFQIWGQRLRGRFRNEYGAHAGFSGAELTKICSEIGPGREVSNDYYNYYYPKYVKIWRVMASIGFSSYINQSVYVLGKRI